MVERRKDFRIKGVLPVKLAHSEYDILTETKDISLSGAYCSVDKPLEIMTKLSIVLLLPFHKKNKSKIVKKIDCNGVVVRKESEKLKGKNSYHVGVYFNDMDERGRKTLHSYINSFRKSSELADVAAG